jgi:hypothetical protein
LLQAVSGSSGVAVVQPPSPQVQVEAVVASLVVSLTVTQLAQ